MIQFGNDKIKEIYHGSDTIKEVYYGSELIWSNFKLSYAILTDGTRIDFGIENTPIANFCNNEAGYGASIVINRVYYRKTLIKEIHFGTSYRGVTEIGDSFLYMCSYLTDITLNFPVLNSIGRFFMAYCALYLVNLTLDFPALNSVDIYFLYHCISLTNLTLTTETPPIVNSSGFMGNISNLSSINVPTNSVNLYKTTSPWSSKSSIIKAIPSYAILTDGTRIDFGIENTPIANFCNYGLYMVINGVSYTKDIIKEIHLISYSGVTVIDNGFLSNCTSLTDIILDFPALKSMGSGFLRSCSSLINVTLNFPVLSSISSHFLNFCPFLTGITLTAETPPITHNAGFLENTPNVTAIHVPTNSVNLYKTTSPWSSKSSIIKAI